MQTYSFARAQSGALCKSNTDSKMALSPISQQAAPMQNTHAQKYFFCSLIISDACSLAKGGIVNLFIVEDSEIVRERMQAMLSSIPGVAVLGYSKDELGALEDINSLLPDVVTLDLGLQSGNGFNVLKGVKKDHPEIKVIVVTNHGDEYYYDVCMRAGADCFFDKTFQLPQVYLTLWAWSNGDSADSNLHRRWKLT